MLRTVFGDRLPRLPLTSSKGAIGHYLGAAGAIEAVATLLCFLHGAVHPTPGEGAVDPAMGLDLVTVSPRAVRGARYALSTNLAFGGTNAAIILGSDTGMTTAVVVTGIGVIGPSAPVARRCSKASGREPRLAEVDRCAGYHRPGGARLAALADLSGSPRSFHRHSPAA